MKYMSVAEFREKGYLLELNRRFLHPLGLAISVATDEDGKESFAPIWDARDDSEGIAFAELTAVDRARARAIDDEWERRAAIGFVIQPLTGDGR